MKTKICIECKKRFEVKHGLQKYCSINCQRNGHLKLNKIRHKNHKQEDNKKNKQYYLLNKQQIKQQHKNWRLKNKEKLKIESKKYRKTHQNQIKKYYKKNKIKIIKQKINKVRNDIQTRLRHYLRIRVGQVLKGNSKLSTTMKLVGCSAENLKQHLEKQFKKGMTWGNHGNGWYGRGMKEWHIDHIKPCCQFDLSKASEQKKCFNYKNLRPLWAEENRRRNKKVKC